MREAGGPSRMTQVYYGVVYNDVCPVYACRADVKTSSFQKLETRSIHWINRKAIAHPSNSG